MDGTSGWLWLFIDVGLVVLLAAAMIYGIIMWRNRSRNPRVERQRDEATRENFRRNGG